MEYFKVMPYIHRIELTRARIETTWKKYPGNSDGFRAPFWLKQPLTRGRLDVKPMPQAVADPTKQKIDMQSEMAFPIDASQDYAMTREAHFDVRFIDKQGHRALPGKRTTQLRANLVRGHGDDEQRIAPLDLGHASGGIRSAMKKPIPKALARRKEHNLTFYINPAMQNVDKFVAQDAAAQGDEGMAGSRQPLRLEIEWDEAVYNPRVLACSSEKDKAHGAKNLFADARQWEAADANKSQWFIIDLGVPISPEYVLLSKGFGEETVLPNKMTLAPMNDKRLRKAQQRARTELKRLKARMKVGSRVSSSLVPRNTGATPDETTTDKTLTDGPWKQDCQALQKEIIRIMEKFYRTYETRRPLKNKRDIEELCSMVKDLPVVLYVPEDGRDTNEDWIQFWHRLEELLGFAHLVSWKKEQAFINGGKLEWMDQAYD